MADPAPVKSFITQFSRIGIFLSLILTITLSIISIINANHYNTILGDSNNGDETLNGVSRGTLFWFLWLNIILATISILLSFYFIYRFLFYGSITESVGIKKLNSALGSMADGQAGNKLMNSVTDAKYCKELGIKGDYYTGDCAEYVRKSDDGKVDYYLEKSFYIKDADVNKKVKDTYCKYVSGSKCNKNLNNLRDEIKENFEPYKKYYAKISSAYAYENCIKSYDNEIKEKQFEKDAGILNDAQLAVEINKINAEYKTSYPCDEVCNDPLVANKPDYCT